MELKPVLTFFSKTTPRICAGLGEITTSCENGALGLSSKSMAVFQFSTYIITGCALLSVDGSL